MYRKTWKSYQFLRIFLLDIYRLVFIKAQFLYVKEPNKFSDCHKCTQRYSRYLCSKLLDVFINNFKNLPFCSFGFLLDVDVQSYIKMLVSIAYKATKGSYLPHKYVIFVNIHIHSVKSTLLRLCKTFNPGQCHGGKGLFQMSNASNTVTNITSWVGMLYHCAFS